MCVGVDRWVPGRCILVGDCTQGPSFTVADWSDIGYSFLVGGDGKVYEGRGWTRQGAHTYGYNSRSLAVSFMGNFMTTAPSSSMVSAAKTLIKCGVSKVRTQAPQEPGRNKSRIQDSQGPWFPSRDFSSVDSDRYGSETHDNGAGRIPKIQRTTDDRSVSGSKVVI